MRRLLVVALAVLAVGCAEGVTKEDGERWPKVRSFCSPDQPGVRIYETAFVDAPHKGAGAAIAVIADPACGGNS